MSAIIRQRSGVILISLRSQLGRTTSGPTGEEIPSTGATGDAALPLGKAVQSNNENRDRTVRNGESMRQITLMIKWLEVESGNSVQRVAHFWPRLVIAGHQQAADRRLEPLHALLGRACTQIPFAVRLITMRAERVAKEIEAFLPGIP